VTKLRPPSAQTSTGLPWQPMAPDNWELKPLCRVASVNDDVLPSRFPLDAEISYIDISSVTYGKGIESTESVVFANAPSRARRLAKKGDVVVSTVRTYLKALAEVGDEHAECVFSTGFAVLRRKPDQLEEGFLKWITSNELLVQAIESHSTGVSYPAINAGDLVKLKVAVPPSNEQVRIAETLDRETARIDALIEKKTRFIELLKEKRQALITQAVTKGLDPTVPMKDSGVEWIGEVPAHWVGSYKLVWLAKQAKGSFVNGPFGSDLLSSELQTEGVPVIYIRDVKPTGYSRKSKDCVTEKKAKQLSVCQVRPGDVLLAKVGSPPGDACVYPIAEPLGIVTQDVVRIRPERAKVVAEYLCFLMNSDIGRSLVDSISVESTRKRFGLGELKQLRVALPGIREQEQIATWIEDRTSKIDALILKSEKSTTLLTERRSALITAAVTGQIDLREEE
jgi:type I restriction enzyme S subunit